MLPPWPRVTLAPGQAFGLDARRAAPRRVEQGPGAPAWPRVDWPWGAAAGVTRAVSVTEHVPVLDTEEREEVGALAVALEPVRIATEARAAAAPEPREPAPEPREPAPEPMEPAPEPHEPEIAPREPAVAFHALDWRGLAFDALEPFGIWVLERRADLARAENMEGVTLALAPDAAGPAWCFGRDRDLRLGPGARVELARDGGVLARAGTVEEFPALEGRASFERLRAPKGALGEPSAASAIETPSDPPASSPDTSAKAAPTSTSPFQAGSESVNTSEPGISAPESTPEPTPPPSEPHASTAAPGVFRSLDWRGLAFDALEPFGTWGIERAPGLARAEHGARLVVTLAADARDRAWCLGGERDLRLLPGTRVELDRAGRVLALDRGVEAWFALEGRPALASLTAPEACLREPSVAAEELPAAPPVEPSLHDPAAWRGFERDALQTFGAWRVERRADLVVTEGDRGRLTARLAAEATRSAWCLGPSNDVELLPGATVVLHEQGTLGGHAGSIHVQAAPAARPAITPVR
ncbi:MAG: hypothetical protein HZA53_12410 [Planctomycetes bacterium]|nr:hypothetical protein [Planctomycetota bacterium]